MYNNVISLVPKDEHFDATAVNEGVWLSAAHLSAIDAALGIGTAEQARLQGELNTANGNATAAQDELQTANNNLATANTTIQQNAARIAELEKKPAVDITATPKAGADNLPEEQNAAEAYMTSVDREMADMRQKMQGVK